MQISDFKYLLAYIIPISGFYAVYHQGWSSYATVIVAFVAIPIIEQFVTKSKANLERSETKNKNQQFFFDLLLLLNLPIILLLVLYLLITISNTPLEAYESAGLCLSVGIVLGACGINVAHELGHKSPKLYQYCAQALLLPCLYMHFFVEHNRGHHLHVATPKDPATSRAGENVYFFWIRSTVFSYLDAWKLEVNRLSKRPITQQIFNNKIFQFTIIQLLYLGFITYLFGVKGLTTALTVALVSFLLLETINYIEHYGLQRKKLANGRYERVMPWHSWNSNHELGRIILYELTRHSDHHFKANKKYQVLDHHDQSPQLPLGYPSSMLLALVPPLWFYIMNRKLSYYNQLNTPK